MLSRRAILVGAPLMAAFPVTGFPIAMRERSVENASWDGRGLSPAVLAAVSRNFVNTAVKTHQGALTQGDLRETVAMWDLLRNHFIEVGFDDAFRKTVGAVDPAVIDFTNSPLIQSAYEAFHKADSTFTLDEVRQAFAQTIRPGSVATQIEELKTRGLTPVISDVEQALANAAQSLPVAYNPRASRAHFVRVSCAGANVAAGFLGAAGLTLGVGCGTPEPFWPAICPAAGVVGLGLGAVALLIFIGCG